MLSPHCSPPNSPVAGGCPSIPNQSPARPPQHHHPSELVNSGPAPQQPERWPDAPFPPEFTCGALIFGVLSGAAQARAAVRASITTGSSIAAIPGAVSILRDVSQRPPISRHAASRYMDGGFTNRQLSGPR